MAYRKTATVQQAIPLRYRCSQCDTEALAVLEAEGEGSTMILSRFMDEYDYKTQNALYRKAFKALKRRIRRIYKKEPQHWYRSIKCQCPNCKHIEPWGNEPGKKAFSLLQVVPYVVLGLLVALLFLGNKLLRYYPYILGGIAALIVIWLLCQILSPRKRRIKAALSNLAPEKLPKYEKTEKEILEIVDKNLKSRIVDEGDGLSIDELTGNTPKPWNR